MDRRKLPESLKYYVYAFVRESGVPYYIGRGCRYRAWEVSNRTIKPPADKTRIKIVKEFLSLDQSSELEKALIDFWGRNDLDFAGVLRNMQEGGLGGSHGRLCSAETREKMAAKKRGVKQSAAHIKARTGHKKGVKHAPEHAKNLAESTRARARAWWNHEDLDIRFFGTATEVVQKFSDQFVGYKPLQGRGLRAGSKLCRNSLNKVQTGKLAHYKGWTAG